MGLFDKIFKLNRQPEEASLDEQAAIIVPDEVLKLRELDSLLNKLLARDHYVARSEYTDIVSGYKDLVQWFQVLRDSGTLEDYCRKNGSSEQRVSEILTRFSNFASLVDSQNEQFIKSKLISEKDYLDGILKECDPAILLDDDQRRVVLTDEDYCLVVAGAGAGKNNNCRCQSKVPCG